MTEMEDVLEDRLNSLKADRDRTKAALERAKSHSSQAIQIDPALLAVRPRHAGRTSAPDQFRSACAAPGFVEKLSDVVSVVMRVTSRFTVCRGNAFSRVKQQRRT